MSSAWGGAGCAQGSSAVTWICPQMKPRGTSPLQERKLTTTEKLRPKTCPRPWPASYQAGPKPKPLEPDSLIGEEPWGRMGPGAKRRKWFVPGWVVTGGQRPWFRSSGCLSLHKNQLLQMCSPPPPPNWTGLCAQHSQRPGSTVGLSRLELS